MLLVVGLFHARDALTHPKDDPPPLVRVETRPCNPEFWRVLLPRARLRAIAAPCVERGCACGLGPVCRAAPYLGRPRVRSLARVRPAPYVERSRPAGRPRMSSARARPRISCTRAIPHALVPGESACAQRASRALVDRVRARVRIATRGSVAIGRGSQYAGASQNARVRRGSIRRAVWFPRTLEIRALARADL